MKLYDVIRKEGRKDTELEEAPVAPQVPTKVEPPKRFKQHTRISWRKIFVIACAIAFFALLYIVGMKVVYAKVIVNERRIPFTLDGAEFELVHEGQENAGRLSFQTMVVPTEVSRQVYGSQIDPSTSAATGKVVFFNEYSTKTQTIKAKTTITSKEGKKYHTTASATVPGYTLKNKIKTAGTSTSVPVVASGVGPAYNTDGTSFTVAGFGKTFYAQSAGAITGGEDGLLHSVALVDQPDVIASLQSQLIERLKRETRAQIPVDLITFPDLQVTTIDSSSMKLRGEGIKFPATIKGTMVTYLIKTDMLESAIASHVLSDHSYPDVSIPDITALTVTPVTALSTDTTNAPDTIRVKISGTGTIITKASIFSIQESLVGSPKKNFSSILGGIPEVDKANYHFYPFWAPLFPNTDKRITVEVQ